MSKLKKINRKGISPIITTILLILISLSAIIVIAGVVVPFVKDTLAESKKCFEISDQLTINTESRYTCHYEAETTGNQVANLTIKRGTKDKVIEGFLIAVSGGGSSESFKIKEGTVPGVRMITGDEALELPERGEERTYSITTNLAVIEYAEIAPIIENEKICEVADKAEIEVCV